jgi:hypothetical protein
MYYKCVVLYIDLFHILTIKFNGMHPSSIQISVVMEYYIKNVFSVEKDLTTLHNVCFFFRVNTVYKRKENIWLGDDS